MAALCRHGWHGLNKGIVMRAFTGGCHCGNIRLVFETARAPAELQVRVCTCGFCRRHGSRTISDHGGRLGISVEDPNKLARYRFALRTVDFLVCRACGVYVAAIYADTEGAWATLNVNALDAATAFTAGPTPISYDEETAAERRTRRRTVWTPTTIAIGE
jgi:hypothetical protein